ncbi:hypothetical protein ABT063_51390 [Streptomyces sp. NPDC002838]|uniref:hypothetical protein n=1 Tax=Streptomyces sp. NPDC002838 TaxID=3154436 RepID=UPI00331A98CD
MIKPLLPPAGRARGRWRDHRQVLEGIVFKFRTGAAEGPSRAVRAVADRPRAVRRWAADGTFDRMLAAARKRADADWLVALDSTIVRAHQHTAARGDSRNEDLDAPAGGSGAPGWTRSRSCIPQLA